MDRSDGSIHVDGMPATAGAPGTPLVSTLVETALGPFFGTVSVASHDDGLVEAVQR